MSTLTRVVLASCWSSSHPAAQSPDPLLSDTRLTVHTLVREDIFAGFRSDNMERLAKAEQNIEVLLKERPDERANLLAWKAGAATYRAVRAHEAGQAAEFERTFASALSDFTAAAKARRPATRAWRRSPAAPWRSSRIGCPLRTGRPRGRRPTTTIRCSGSSRAPGSRRCPCI